MIRVPKGLPGGAWPMAPESFYKKAAAKISILQPLLI
jgi:hypothetical protein